MSHPPAISVEPLAGLDGVRHGFFSREGGVSGGIYASLNCGPGSDDAPGDVGENRARVAATLGLPASALVTVHQVHSPKAVIAEAPWGGGAVPEADALVTRTGGLALGVLTADCGPVLFADPEARVVAAAHAGWRGALGGVLDATVEAMTRIGASRDRIRAAVGPCIGPESYEVGEEVRAAFVADRADNDRHFRPSGRAGHYLFDLPGYLVARLESLDILEARASGHDTLADEERFFSYRRTTFKGEPDYGRQLSVVALDP